MNFYAIIIGTEILNGRREDKHFEFLKNELAKYGHELFASFIIKDEMLLIERAFEFVKADPKGILFSFGGIGSTPDDLTRAISAKVFRNGVVELHPKFAEDIIERFQEEAYPHRIHMAEIPVDATLLFNPVNNMSGYGLDDRYFFVPGFPSMAHPMISGVIEKYFSQRVKKYRKTLLAKTSEERLTTLMQSIPPQIELSSLPMFVNSMPNVELSLLGTDENEVEHYFSLFVNELIQKGVEYQLI